MAQSQTCPCPAGEGPTLWNLSTYPAGRRELVAVRKRPGKQRGAARSNLISRVLRAAALPKEGCWQYNINGSVGAVVHADVLDLLKAARDRVADIVFLDPPFNLGKKYSKSDPKLDRRPHDEYKSWLYGVLDESARILKPGGALFLYHLPVWAMRCGTHMEELGLTLHQWIAVSMKSNFVRGRHLYPAHYALLMFTKGKPKRFSRPKLSAAKCRHCGGYVKDYGGYLKIIEHKGLNLSDVWDDVSPVRHANRKNRPGNELPVKLLERVIHISGVRGGLYVDPFAGAGTGALCAAAAGMRFVVSDVVESSCEVTRQRLEQMMSQEGDERANAR